MIVVELGQDTWIPAGIRIFMSCEKPRERFKEEGETDALYPIPLRRRVCVKPSVTPLII